MGDYISREKAIKEVVVNSVKHRADPDVATDMIRGIEKLPAADVRPVALCKDCRYDHHCMIQDFMEDDGITPDDQNNFFCGYGEREEQT